MYVTTLRHHTAGPHIVIIHIVEMLAGAPRLQKLRSSAGRCSFRRPLVAPVATMQQQPHRTATVKRKTKETEVEVTIDLDGQGVCVAETPVGFLNHMLDQISSHGLFDLKVIAKVRGGPRGIHVVVRGSSEADVFVCQAGGGGRGGGLWGRVSAVCPHEVRNAS